MGEWSSVGQGESEPFKGERPRCAACSDGPVQSTWITGCLERSIWRFPAPFQLFRPGNGEWDRAEGAELTAA